MSLLPQELSGPQERLRMLELPSLVGGENKETNVKNPPKSSGCIEDVRRWLPGETELSSHAGVTAGGHLPPHCTTG